MVSSMDYQMTVSFTLRSSSSKVATCTEYGEERD